MEEVVVEFRQVTRRFGTVAAVDGVSLQVRRGEFFSLLGPSGCGKTTTLRMIAGFEEPTSGEIRINGVDVTHLPPYQRRVNTVFQNYALFPHLDVFENVAFGLRRRGMSSKDVSAKVEWILGLVRLQGLQRRRIQQMSGGQQQRVALARALVNEPDVLLLDEPLAALDQKLRREMQFELKRLQKELGITFVLVTHDQEEALTMSDSVAVMNHGRVEQVGGPRDIYDHPATRFVADFIGTANFLPVQVRAVQNGRTTVVLSGRDLLVPSRQGVTEGARAELSVRPERLWLTRDGADENGNSLPGKVVETVFMGAFTRFAVEVSEGHVLLAEQQNQKQCPSTEFRPGEAVWVHWQPTSATLLPGGVSAS